jgi:hypothetical protein
MKCEKCNQEIDKGWLKKYFTEGCEEKGKQPYCPYCLRTLIIGKEKNNGTHLQ